MQSRHSFIGSTKHPYHLSVGAVLYNDRHEIAVHSFDAILQFKDIIVLMRETVEAGETLEETIARGLREEFGATGEIEAYLGSLQSTFSEPGREEIQKTTEYFLVQMKTFEPETRRASDEERHSQIQWRSPAELIPIMQQQRPQATHLDESEVIRRAIKLLP